MKYRYSPKILFIGMTEGAPDWARTVFRASTDLYWVSRNSSELGIVDDEGRASTLTDPLTGPTIIVTANDDDPELVDAVQAIWRDAGLEPPQALPAPAQGEEPGKLTNALMTIQARLVQDAARRNVSLLKQVAALRQSSEDLNLALAHLIKKMKGDEGTAKAVYEPVPHGDGVVLPPSKTLRQRIPISVVPQLIGGLSCYVTTDKSAALTMQVWSEERQQVIYEHRFDASPGLSVLFLPFGSPLKFNAKLLDLLVTNEGSGEVMLGTALCESPEERAQIDGAPDLESHHALRLDLWSHSDTKAGTHPLPGFRVSRTLSNHYLAEFKKRTPEFSDRNWLNLPKEGGLLVHPLPNTTAIASLEEFPVSGRLCKVSCDVMARHVAKSTILACVSVTRKAVDPDTLEEVNEYASGSAAERFEEIARTEWIPVVPGTQKDFSLSLDVSDCHLKDCHLNLMTTTSGESTSHAHFIFKEVALTIEQDLS
ncbi:DUF6212 domain-containing protein [Roseovarius salinarum]|uniref:DUF6212 domain-containing protein n=1 Tax=Roseovarius salinarum TaxID=1981892 RepID=UPI001E4E9F53|nr:DUF6212 domain-containing protein [Roseovarius salinarum]